MLIAVSKLIIAFWLPYHMYKPKKDTKLFFFLPFLQKKKKSIKKKKKRKIGSSLVCTHGIKGSSYLKNWGVTSLAIDTHQWSSCLERASLLHSWVTWPMELSLWNWPLFLRTWTHRTKQSCKFHFINISPTNIFIKKKKKYLRINFGLVWIIYW